MMTKLYFSLLCGRLSSAKTSDEEELHTTKTCNNDRSQLDVLITGTRWYWFSGLVLSLKKSYRQHDSSNLQFNRSERQFEIGFDGASLNLVLCALEKEAV